MDKTQWLVLQISLVLILFLFISIDTSAISCGVDDVYCLLNSEIYDPFILLIGSLALVVMILGWLEPKKKKVV